MYNNHQCWSLQNKTALITGGTRGIGHAIAEEFLNLGANVCVICRNQQQLTDTLTQWEAKGLSAQGIIADLSQGIDICQYIMSEIKKHWSQLDILVNNAGINIRKAAESYTPEEYHTVMQVNVNAAFGLCQQAYPLLKKSTSAAVINIASISGLIDDASGAPYGMSKASLIQLSKHLAVEWAKDNIRVNSIAPWYIATELTQATLTNPEKLNRIIARTPLARPGKPQEIAGLAAFLAMPLASYITGQCITIDGGFMANGFAEHQPTTK